MVGGHAAIQANGASDMVCRQLVFSSLKGHDAEQMPGIGILGSDGKNTLIDFGRGIQLPRLVVLHRNG